MAKEEYSILNLVGRDVPVNCFHNPPEQGAHSRVSLEAGVVQHAQEYATKNKFQQLAELKVSYPAARRCLNICTNTNDSIPRTNPRSEGQQEEYMETSPIYQGQTLRFRAFNPPQDKSCAVGESNVVHRHLRRYSRIGDRYV